MDYREFVSTVEKSVASKMEEGVKVTAYTAVKNNGKEKTGIVIETPGINISPTIYLEEYYEASLAGKPLEKITDDIIAFYTEIKREQSWDYNRILEFEGVRDRIVFKLINTKKNQEFLESVPHVEMLDLSLVFYVLLEVSSEGTAAMMVTNSHIEKWEVSTEVLHKAAAENSKRLLPAEFFTMNYAMRELLGSAAARRDKENLLNGEQAASDGMYVLSNRIRSYGAACIAYPYILEMIGGILKSDYYILPSSVHEVVIVPDAGDIDSRELDEMIREINITQVADEEVLSDHSYFFENRTGRLRAGTKRRCRGGAL